MEKSCNICSLHARNQSSHLSSTCSPKKRDQKAAEQQQRQQRGRRSCRGMRVFCFYCPFLQSKEAASMYQDMNHSCHKLRTDGTNGSPSLQCQCAYVLSANFKELKDSFLFKKYGANKVRKIAWSFISVIHDKHGLGQVRPI